MELNDEVRELLNILRAEFDEMAAKAQEEGRHKAADALMDVVRRCDAQLS